jgi:spermidine/putrescine transport system substrate-binding protein
MKTLLCSLLALATASFAPVLRAEEPLAKELNLFIWGDYIDPEVLADFEKEFGVKVVESNFDSNESMLSKVESGAVAYDVVTPSDYMVRVMRRQGLLQPLDHANIPNLKGLAPEVQSLEFDPKNEISVPYKWGVTGIGYNKKLVKTPPTGWADLLDPKRIAPYKGMIGMLDDQREVIGGALVLLGLSNNTTSPADIAKAREVLLAQRPFVAKYDSSAYYQSLASGELAMALGFSQEIALAAQENPDIEFVIPKEGATFYMDTLAVPKSSKNKRTAEIFINFILRPEISARIANFTQGPSPVEAAKPLIDESVRNGIAYRLPPPDKRLLLDDVGDSEKLYGDLWTELKTQ